MKVDLDVVLKAIADEPELPSGIPAELIKFMTTPERIEHAMRAAVRATKDNIRFRVMMLSHPGHDSIEATARHIIQTLT